MALLKCISTLGKLNQKLTVKTIKINIEDSKSSRGYLKKDSVSLGLFEEIEARILLTPAIIAN